MYLFLLFLFPLYYVFFSRRRPFVFTSGLVASAVVCAVRMFFMFRMPYTGASFPMKTMFLWCTFVLIPVCIAFALFLLVTRGPLEVRISAFLPFELAFFAVYVPVEIFAQSSEGTLFLLFVKPVLFMAMLLMADFLVRALYAGITGGAFMKVVLAVIVLLFVLFLPVLIETFWYFDYSWLVWGSMSLLYCFPVLGVVIQKSGLLPAKKAIQ